MFLCIGMLSTGFVFSLIHISNNTNSYQGLIYACKANYFLLNSGGERLYVYAKNNNYDIGDIVTIQGEKEDLSFDTLESSFDFKEYLRKKGVYHSLKVKSIKVNYHNFIRIKERREKLLSLFNDEERSIVGAILFSDGGDSELADSLRELHLARFFGRIWSIYHGISFRFKKSILAIFEG